MTAWFFQNLAWASVVILFVLLIRRPFAHAFGAGPAYALWLLPAARLLAPPASWFTPDLTGLMPAIDLILLADGGGAAPALAEGRTDWLSLALVAWGSGAAVFFAWQWLGYRQFLTRLSLNSRSLGGHGGVPLIESQAVCGPLALGLLDRRIVVPADFETRYSPQEQRLALDHELVHHRRGDIWCNHAALLFLGLNWFNPIAWPAFRAFRIDQELACDAAVAAAAPIEARADYARALVKSATRERLIATCPLNQADQLKRRLKMMKDHRKSRLRLLGGAAALVLLGGASLSLGSPGLAHPHPGGEDGERRREHVVILETRDGEHGPRPDLRGERDGRMERFVIRRHGDRGERAEPGERGRIREMMLPRGCDGDSEAVLNLDEGNESNRTRIIVCADDAERADGASRIEVLERARERMAQNDRLSGEHRDRVLQAIDQAIARARAQ